MQEQITPAGDIVDVSGGNADGKVKIDTVSSTGGVITAITINVPGTDYSKGDIITVSGGNSDATASVVDAFLSFVEIPGGDGNNDNIIDCEIDYDQDLDDDRLRPFDQNYNGIYDWLDPDLGGTTSPDNLGNVLVSGDATNFEYDLDDDNIDNENDSFPLDKASDVLAWNCPTTSNPNPLNPILGVKHGVHHTLNSMIGMETVY